MHILIDNIFLEYKKTKQTGINTCKEGIAFDRKNKNWPHFQIELYKILIKIRLYSISLESSWKNKCSNPNVLLLQSLCIL